MRINPIRRSLVAVLAAACLKPFAALAATWNKDGFGAKTAADALKALGAGNPLPSKDLLIEAPQIAENGAVVPIEITSNVPGTTSIAVLIDKNPFPLVGKFDFTAGALPFIQNVTVKLNGRTVVESQISQGISRNPVFTFRLKGGAKGDRVEVSWIDNHGETNQTETAVA